MGQEHERRGTTVEAQDGDHAVRVDVHGSDDGPTVQADEAGEAPAAGEASAPEATPVADSSGDALVRERDDLRDRLLRTAAEFDNYRKRVDRDRREQAEWAAAELLSAMLPIVDDLERALGADAAADPDGFRKGVELIHRQLLDLLARRGVVPIEAVGVTFDPRWHEAVVHEPSDTRQPGEVTAELRRGYKLGDRLLRASMVKVAGA